MKLAYRENVLEHISADQLKARNAIMQKLNDTGKISTTDSEKLMQIERKIRVCGQCGKGFGDVMEGIAFATAYLDDENTIPIGYHMNCMKCSLQDIFF